MTTILSTIESPADIKKLSLPQLEILASEIRERLIHSVSKTGGHIGPNLGVVELTIAMHYVFDTPTDSFVFDVSHQAYVHKLLTGREKLFHTIRQPGGLNGFMLRTESMHDSYGAGHAGTALSAALGMAVARDMSGGSEHIVALAGDAAFTNGISFEALNNIASQTKRLIVVLNDNAWSIDKNVGAIAEYFHKIVTNPTIAGLHERATGLIGRFGGKTATHLQRKAEEAAKGLIGPGMLFEEFGLTYFGPLDGHNLPLLIDTFKFLKQQNRPRHPPRHHAEESRLSTRHRTAEEVPRFLALRRRHRRDQGRGPEDLLRDLRRKPLEASDRQRQSRSNYGSHAQRHRLDLFRPLHPTRYFDVGIAEEHAVIFAAGMATKGYKTLRRHLLYLPSARLRPDRPRRLPAEPARRLLHGPRRPLRRRWPYPSRPFRHQLSALGSKPHPHGSQGRERASGHDVHRHASPRPVSHPVSTRHRPRNTPEAAAEALAIGKAEVIQDGEDVAIFGLGAMLPEARRLAALLEDEGLSVAVINPRFAKPIDANCVATYGNRCGLLITMEDHVLAGGFGSAVLESVNAQEISTPIVRVGWPDEFIEHGKPDALRSKYGLTAEAALEKARPYLAPLYNRHMVAQ